MNFDEVLDEVRKSLGPTPRKLSSRHKIKMPAWVFFGDGLLKVFWQQAKLLREGRVVWGSLVQANALLFEPGAENHPGNLLYSFAPETFARPGILATAASGLYNIKGLAVSDPELQQFSDTLADEMERLLKVPVPSRLTDGIDCIFTGTMFDRKHLPEGRLDGGLMPLLAHPDMEATMVVPYWHWPEAFIQACW